MGTLRVKQIKSTNNTPLTLGSNTEILGTLYVSGETTFSDVLVNNIKSDNYAVTFENSLSVNDPTKLGDVFTDGDILTESFYTAEGNLFVTSDLIVSNNLTVNSDLSINNDLDIGGSLSATFLYGDGSNISNLPDQNLFKSSVGFNSITQNNDTNEYFNFGESSTSLGDNNTSNANYGLSLGYSNISGAISKYYTLGVTKRHLVILDDVVDVVSDFSTGNTITGITSNPVHTGVTITSVTSTTVGVSILSISPTGNCYNYKVRNLSNSATTVTYVDCCGITKTLTLSGYSNVYTDICSQILPTASPATVQIRDNCAGPGTYGCTKWYYNNSNPFNVTIFYYGCSGNQINTFTLSANTQGRTPCIKFNPWYQQLPSGSTLILNPSGPCCLECDSTATASIITTTIISSITTTTSIINVPTGIYNTGCTQYTIFNNSYNPINVEYGDCNSGFLTGTTVGAYLTKIICSSVTPIIINAPWMTGYTSPVWGVSSMSSYCTTYSAQVITTSAITYSSFTTYTTACTSTLVGYTSTTTTVAVEDMGDDVPLITGRIGNVLIKDNRGESYIGVVTNIITGITSGTTITGLTNEGGSELILENLSGGELRSYAILYLDEEISNNSTYGRVVNSGKGRGSVASGISTQSKGIASVSQNQSTISLGDYSHSEGLGSISEGLASNAGGMYSKTTQTGEFARSSGMFSSVGDAQYSIISMLGSTTATTNSYLFVDGISEKIKIQENSLVSLSLQINAVVSVDLSGKGGEGEGAMFYKNDILIRNDGSKTLTIINGSGIARTSQTSISLNPLRINIVAGDTYSDYSEINFELTGVDETIINWNGMITMTKTII